MCSQTNPSDLMAKGSSTVVAIAARCTNYSGRRSIAFIFGEIAIYDEHVEGSDAGTYSGTAVW